MFMLYTDTLLFVFQRHTCIVMFVVAALQIAANVFLVWKMRCYITSPGKHGACGAPVVAAPTGPLPPPAGEPNRYAGPGEPNRYAGPGEPNRYAGASTGGYARNNDAQAYY